MNKSIKTKKQISKTLIKLLNYKPLDLITIKELTEKISKERLLYLIYELSELANNIKWSSQKSLMFEAGMIKSCMQIENKIQNINVGVGVPDDPQKNNKPTQNINNNETGNKSTNTVGAGPVSARPNTTTQSKPKQTTPGSNLPYWNNVINKIKQNGKMGIYVNLIGSTAKEINDMTIEVLLANKNSFGKEILEAQENKAEIEKIASMEAGKTMNVRFVSTEDKKTSNIKSNSSIENMIEGLDIPINIIDE